MRACVFVCVCARAHARACLRAQMRARGCAAPSHRVCVCVRVCVCARVRAGVFDVLAGRDAGSDHGPSKCAVRRSHTGFSKSDLLQPKRFIIALLQIYHSKKRFIIAFIVAILQRSHTGPSVDWSIGAPARALRRRSSPGSTPRTAAESIAGIGLKNLF